MLVQLEEVEVMANFETISTPLQQLEGMQKQRRGDLALP